jgi:GTPase SAR1 family protein
MNHIKDEILKKYIAGEIESDQEKYKILELNKECFKICEGRTLLVLGEMTLVVGGKNSGKSKLINYLIKQILTENCDEGFFLSNPLDYKVISFDSEMGINRLIEWSIKSIYEDEFGLNYLKDNLQDKLFLYSLKRISPEDRVNYICIIVEGLKKDFPNTHFIICLDVGTCLTSDTNSSLNGGLIDNLVNKLEGSTLIVTIHNSFKEDTKEAIGMGSIGTALEKYCAIKLLIKPTDEEKRHKIEFVVSKYEDVNKIKDYFFIHTKKDIDDKIFITGISDSNGIISIKKGNTKVETDDFKFYLFELIKNSTSYSDRLRKNIVPVIKEKFEYGSTSVFNKIKKLIEEGDIKEIDGELIIN